MVPSNPPLTPGRFERAAFALTLLVGVLPLWVSKSLPLVDLPQHLHLISVLHRLNDPTTLFPEVFQARGQLTPYLGYYYLASLLNWLVPLETANRLLLTATVAGLAGAMAFLLRSLGRPTWPALFTLPFAYGDSLAWGFLNFCASLPLTLLSCGLFVRAMTSPPPARRPWAVAAAACQVAVLLFHIQGFLFLAFALPWLLVATRAVPASSDPSPAQQGALARWLVPRAEALASVVPGVALFLVWIVGRLGEPSQVEQGAPWKAWGPMLSPQNLSFKTFEQNRGDFFQVLANQLADGSDRYGLYAALAACALALLARLALGGPGEQQEGPLERWRVAGLAAIALALYFLLPFDIRGYIYYLNTRYAHLAAPLLVAALPPVRGRAAQLLLGLGPVAALALCIPLVRGFRAFDAEAAGLRDIVRYAAPKARVMGLIFQPGSSVVRHPVFLHSAAQLAMERGGLANFSFALTPHSPVAYRGTPPRTFPSEWNPAEFRWEVHAGDYDHFLVRGVHPARLFGGRLGGELEVAGHEGSFWLMRRVAPLARTSDQ